MSPVNDDMEGSMRFTVKKALIASAISSALAIGTATAGPVILMGIDAEDGGVNSHGPTSNYISVVSSLLGSVSNSGTGILVIGGGKDPSDDVTAFWTAVDAGISGHSVTYVNGAAGITAASFSGYAAIAVASTVQETSSGGLTDAESTALNARAAAIAAFVNTGGGLFGLSQDGAPVPYGYLGGVAPVTTADIDYEDITPTTAGAAIGITNSLDICCWHDQYLTFPSFLQVLATDAEHPGNIAAAIGGATVTITVPEPGTIALLGAALLGGFGASRRWKFATT